MADQVDDKHFDKIFFFICALVAGVMLIDISVFFFPLSQTGQKYVDNNLPVLNTGAMMAGILYLLGGNPAAKKPDNTTPITGDNTTVVNNPPNSTGTPIVQQPGATS